MTIEASVPHKLSVTETVDSSVSPAAGDADRTLTFDGYNTTATLNGTSTPVADTVCDESRTMAGASEDIDLTACKLARDVSQTVDLTGKKLVAITIKVRSGGAVTIAPGATNGYNLFGASGQLTLSPGMQVTLSVLAGTAAPTDAVGAADKIINLAGAAGRVVDILMVFGTPA